MEYKNAAKLMALMFFISSGVSAFCLYHFASIMVTGKLPYGLGVIKEDKPVVEGEESEAKKVIEETEKELEEKPVKAGAGYMNRINEKMVRELYRRLQEKEAKISRDRADVAAERKSAEEILGQAKQTQEELRKYREKIRSLLDEVDAKEIANLKKITTMLEGLEIEQAVTMFKTYDKNKAARILYYMNPKVAKSVVANILETATDDLAKENIRDITERMHRLTEEIKDE